MPSEHTTTIVHPPEDQRHVRAIVKRAGVEFPTFTVDGEVRTKLSPVVRFALAYTAAGLKAGADAKVTPAAAQATEGAKPDAVRLSEAMGRAGLSQNATDRAAGVAKGTTRNALSGSVSLAAAGGGALLAWVERQERA